MILTIDAGTSTLQYSAVRKFELVGRNFKSEERAHRKIWDALELKPHE